ncbi:MAG TPA: ATP-binding cassette domain-containing protein [Candidatus Dormibacteraeota bacterium]
MDSRKVAALVAARDLVKRFPARGGRRGEFLVAVAGVSLDLEAGGTLGLVGESGSGKSTVGRLLLHLLRPDSGTISFDGQSLEHLGSGALRKLRMRMQIIFQNPYSALNPRMTVEDIVAFNLGPVRLSGKQRKDRVLETLKLVGLGREILGRYPHQLSGGQAQRVGIARALVSNPDFIVADEIVSALDVSVQAEILALLLDLRSRLRLTTLFISHNLNVVRYVSDRSAVMYKGRIVEMGPTKQLYDSPVHPYTRLLIASVPGAEPDASLESRERERREHLDQLHAYPVDSPLIEVSSGHWVQDPRRDGSRPAERTDDSTPMVANGRQP